MDSFEHATRAHHASHVCPGLGISEDDHAIALKAKDGAIWLWAEDLTIEQIKAESSKPLQFGHREHQPDAQRFLHLLWLLKGMSTADIARYFGAPGDVWSAENGVQDEATPRQWLLDEVLAGRIHVYQYRPPSSSYKRGNRYVKRLTADAVQAELARLKAEAERRQIQLKAASDVRQARSATAAKPPRRRATDSSVRQQADPPPSTNPEVTAASVTASFSEEDLSLLSNVLNAQMRKSPALANAFRSAAQRDAPRHADATLPQRLYGGGYGSPGDDPDYQHRVLNASNLEDDDQAAPLYDTDETGQLVEWVEPEIPGRRYRHDATAGTLEVTENGKRIGRFLVRNGIVFDPREETPVARLDTEGTIRPIGEANANAVL